MRVRERADLALPLALEVRHLLVQQTHINLRNYINTNARRKKKEKESESTNNLTTKEAQILEQA